MRRAPVPWARRALLATGPALLAAALAGCGAATPGALPPPGTASAIRPPAAFVSAAATNHGGRGNCAATVTDELGGVAMRIYAEAVSSGETRLALRSVRTSPALRAAVAGNDVPAARAAIRALIATGHMVRVRVFRAGRMFVDEGARAALGGVQGALPATGGAPATFAVAVQDARGLMAATQGLSGGAVIVRSGSRVLAGRLHQLPARLPDRGSIQHRGRAWRVFSFPARTLGGAPVKVSLLRLVASPSPPCGHSPLQTRALAAGFVGLHIYRQEARGGAARRQLARAANSAALVSALAHRDPTAARRAIVSLLNQHVVRVRVLRDTQFLADVGGPNVLAPVVGTVRLPGGGTGQLELSVQDDLGYLLLAQRLIGVDVLIRNGAHQVMGTLHPGPAQVPDFGPVSWAGRDYEAFSFTASRFPSGALRISLLLPAR